MELSVSTDYTIQRISDNSYICRDEHNKFYHSKGKSQAMRGTKEKMQSVLNNCFKPTERTNYKVVLFSSNPVVTVGTFSDETNPSIYEAINILKTIDKESLKTVKTELNDSLNNIAQEICDIEHYIEFFNFDAATGYKAYHMLHERLNSRRIIKDNLEKLSILSTSTMADVINGTFENRLNGLNNRKYSPRVLVELFGNSNEVEK